MSVSIYSGLQTVSVSRLLDYWRC